MHIVPSLIVFAMDMPQCHHVELDKRLDRLKKDLRNAQRRQQRLSTVPEAMWRIAAAIFIMAHPATEPACLYLEQRWKHWHDNQDAARQRLNLWHAELSSTTGFGFVLKPDTPSGEAALNKARRFLQEIQLHKFVDEANRTKGIAPLTSALVNKAASQSTLSLPPLVALKTKRKHQLQWLRRWRRRWNIGLGSLHARDTLPAMECRKKVLSKKH